MAAYILFIVVLAGCSTTHPVEVGSVNLAISVRDPIVTIGDRIQLDYEIRNDRKETIKGCLTFAEGFDLWGTKGVKQSISADDHPSCQTNFQLASGESLRWRSDFNVPDIGVGPAKLTGWVQLAVPGSCDAYGCDKTVVRSNDVTLTLQEK